MSELDVKTVLFDMDGVLYDSMPNHADAWVKTATFYGIDSTPEDFYLLEGATMAYTVNKLFQRQFGTTVDTEMVKTVYAKKTAYFETLPAPGAMKDAYEVLKLVKGCGLLPVIVTGSSQRTLLDRIERTFPGIFNDRNVVTGNDVKHGKPHPEPYLMGLAKGGFLPHQAMVVENAPLGVESGRAAGVFTIAVNTGPLADSVLLDAGANVLFHSMGELAEELRNHK